MLQLPLYELSEVTTLLDSSILIQLSVPWGAPCPSWPWGNTCPAGRDPQQLQFHSSMSHSSIHSLPLSIPTLPAVLSHGWQISPVHPCPEANIHLGTLAATPTFLCSATLTDLVRLKGISLQKPRWIAAHTFPLDRCFASAILTQHASFLCAAMLPVPHLAPHVNVTSACQSNGCCNLFILCATRKLISRKIGSWLLSLLEATTYASTAWTRFVSLN